MTSIDLEQRVERALATRAAAVDVEPGSLDEVLADRAPSPRRRPSRTATCGAAAAAVLALVVGAVVVIDRASEEGVQVVPAETSPTTARAEQGQVPRVDATWLPDGMGPEPAWSSRAPDGSSSLTGWAVAPERWVAVSLSRWPWSDDLAAALSRSDGPAVVRAASAMGDDEPVVVGDEPSDEELRRIVAHIRSLGPAADDRSRVDPLLVGHDVVLLGSVRSRPDEPVAVTPSGVTAFPGEALVLHVVADGLRHEEVLGVLRGLRLDGEPAVGAGPPPEPWVGVPSDLPTGAPIPFGGATVVPDRWVPTGPAHASEDVVTWTYRPLDRSWEDLVPPDFREISVSVVHQQIDAEARAALDGDDAAAVVEAFGWFGSATPPEGSTGVRAERLAGRWVLVSGTSLDADDLGLGDLGTRSSTRMLVVVGRDLTLQVVGEQVDEQVLRDVLTGVLLVP